MQTMTLRLLRRYRRTPGVPLVAALLLLGGCGSSSSSSGSSSQRSTGSASAQSQSTPQALDATLTKSIAKDLRWLKHVKLNCPKQTGYPAVCPMTAIDTTGGKARPVKGAATVSGVHANTHAPAYRVIYVPTRR